LHEQINSGIEAAFHRGILRSASIMPNGSAFEDAVRIAKSATGLGIGIHLSLVDERSTAPIAEVRGLADSSGRLPGNYKDFLLGWALRRFGERAIRAEVTAQIDRVRGAGLVPTHLDSHQHLHLLPAVLSIVLDAAVAAKIPVVRLTDEAARGGGLKRVILARLSRRALPRLRARGIRTADRFWGLARSGSMIEANLQHVLEGLEYGVNELMCHPGFSDPQTRARYPWQYRWDEEAAALMSGDIRAYIDNNGIRLTNFGDAWDS